MTQLNQSSWLTKGRLYSICALLFALFCNQISFQGSRLVSFWRYHYDFTVSLDGKVPFLPWTLTIYFGAFLFWAFNLYLISLQDREHSDRLFCADAISKAVSGLFFVIIPTTYVRPEIVGSGLFEEGMRFLYWIDPGDNLFPSIHCSMSWLCWIGLRGKKNIPFGYRAFSLLFAIAVCVSTLTTKQHVFVDTIGGVVLAELSWWAAGRVRVRAVYTRFIEWFMSLVSRILEHRAVKE